MLSKLIVVVMFWMVQSTRVENESHEWEIAVAVNDQIHFLGSNGTLIGGTAEIFNDLKALTFDNVRHQLVVSDMDGDNDTISRVNLSDKNEFFPIISDLPDDVLGLAIDPITDVLYWTDTKNRTINYLALNSTESSQHPTDILLSFKNEEPWGLVIDVCERFLYWTNVDPVRPTIEKAKLDGSDKQILINSNITRPLGITIDYYTKRLYWVDDLDGIYFSIESSDLNGKERQRIVEDKDNSPLNIAVNKYAIYWTDTNHDALWKVSKISKERSVPVKVQELYKKPRGLIVKNVEIKKLPECEKLADLMTDDIFSFNHEAIDYSPEVSTEVSLVPHCLNQGQLAKGKCQCRRGYTGTNCEINLCHNYCLNGDCQSSSSGQTTCHCLPGFVGRRCERNMCDDYCLNGGLCLHANQNTPICNCGEGFVGSRCEFKTNLTQICDDYCQKSSSHDFLPSDDVSAWCSCSEKLDAQQQQLQISDMDDFMKRLSDPWFLGLLVWLIISPLLMALIVVYMCCVYRKKRPTIKKRIIVNKNVQPLTYRPQSTEQCEITIENCCNMNVCETPCFEPRGFKRNDDKKTLLGHMENSEDMY